MFRSSIPSLWPIGPIPDLCSHRAPGLQGASGAAGCAYSAGKRDPAEPRPGKGHQAWACCVAQLEGEAQYPGVGASPGALFTKGLVMSFLTLWPFSCLFPR